VLLKDTKTTKLLTKNQYDVLEQLKIINNNDSVFVISGKLWPWLVTISGNNKNRIVIVYNF